MLAAIGAEHVDVLIARDGLLLEDLEEGELQLEVAFQATEWGVPGLDEIASLVLSSSQVSDLLARSSSG